MMETTDRVKGLNTANSVGQVMSWFVLAGEMYYYTALCSQRKYC